MPLDVEALKARLAGVASVRATGRVLAVTGLSLRFALPGVRVGDVVTVHRRGEPLDCEVVGFDGGQAIAMPSEPSPESARTTRWKRPNCSATV